MQNIKLDSADWQIISTGLGPTRFDGLVLEPQAATVSTETHAPWLISTFIPPKDFRVRVRFINERQLRTGSVPNAWEVFWLFFNYNIGADKNKVTNYFIVKPIGCELGTASGTIGQKMLWTSAVAQPVIGNILELDITKVGQNIVARLNGVIVCDTTCDGSLLDVPGSLGLYSEDCKVRVLEVNLI